MGIEKEIKELEGQIVQIKNDIAELGEMRNGSISEQYNICGNPACRCKDKENPQKHGPYYQLSYSFNKRSTSEFVRSEDVGKVRKQLSDYKTFIRLKDEWVGISIQLAKLRKGKK